MCLHQNTRNFKRLKLDLGVYVDGDLSLEAHISPARAFITFVSYVSCAGVSTQTQINRLQSILRAAARLVLQLPGLASVSNLMRVQLHWLSIPQRIQFKLCSVVYRCLHNTAPIYLWDLCVPISSLEGRSHLRSAAAGDLRIPSAKTVTIGRRGFSVVSCGLEQSIHYSERLYFNFHCFKKLLKTELSKSLQCASAAFVFERCITNISLIIIIKSVTRQLKNWNKIPFLVDVVYLNILSILLFRQRLHSNLSQWLRNIWQNHPEIKFKWITHLYRNFTINIFRQYYTVESNEYQVLSCNCLFNSQFTPNYSLDVWQDWYLMYYSGICPVPWLTLIE